MYKSFQYSNLSTTDWKPLACRNLVSEHPELTLTKLASVPMNVLFRMYELELLHACAPQALLEAGEIMVSHVTGQNMVGSYQYFAGMYTKYDQTYPRNMAGALSRYYQSVLGEGSRRVSSDTLAGRILDTHPRAIVMRNILAVGILTEKVGLLTKPTEQMMEGDLTTVGLMLDSIGVTIFASFFPELIVK